MLCIENKKTLKIVTKKILLKLVVINKKWQKLTIRMKKVKRNHMRTGEY